MSEALDLVAVEAHRERLQVDEVDTSGRPIQRVARDVDALLRGRRPRGRRRPDWLADPTVTAHLLDEPE